MFKEDTESLEFTFKSSHSYKDIELSCTRTLNLIHTSQGIFQVFWKLNQLILLLEKRMGIAIFPTCISNRLYHIRAVHRGLENRGRSQPLGESRPFTAVGRFEAVHSRWANRSRSRPLGESKPFIAVGQIEAVHSRWANRSRSQPLGESKPFTAVGWIEAVYGRWAIRSRSQPLGDSKPFTAVGRIEAVHSRWAIRSRLRPLGESKPFTAVWWFQLICESQYISVSILNFWNRFINYTSFTW